MTNKLAIHNITQPQNKLRHSKNNSEQFTRYFPKNSEHTANTQLKGLVALTATQWYV